MDIAQVIANRSATDIISCQITTRVRDAIAMLAQRRIGALPVVDGGRVVGIFSERDVIYRLASEGDDGLSLQVGQVMTSPAVTVDAATSVVDALALMTSRRFRHLPVMRGSELIGFVSIGDLVKSRLDEIQHEAEAMREYITHG